MEWDSAEFHIWKGEAIVSEGLDHNYLSIRFQEEEKWPEEYALFAYDFANDTTLLLWMANDEAFEKLVAKSKLQGSIHKSEESVPILPGIDHEWNNTNVKITSCPDQILEVLNDPESPDLFHYRGPLVLRKVVKEIIGE